MKDEDLEFEKINAIKSLTKSVQDLTHVMEDLVSHLRTGTISLVNDDGDHYTPNRGSKAGQ